MAEKVAFDEERRECSVALVSFDLNRKKKLRGCLGRGTVTLSPVSILFRECLVTNYKKHV